MHVFYNIFFIRLMFFTLLYENYANVCFIPIGKGVPLPTVPPQQLLAMASQNNHILLATARGMDLYR